MHGRFEVRRLQKIEVAGIYTRTLQFSREEKSEYSSNNVIYNLVRLR